MEDELAPRDRRAREFQIGEVPVEEFDSADVIEIGPFAGDEGISDPDAMATPHELPGEMGSDEARAAGHEVIRH